MKNKYWYIIAVVILAVAAIYSYKTVVNKSQPKILSEESNKKNEPTQVKEDASDEVTASVEDSADLDKLYADLSAKCENGDWVEMGQVSGTISNFSGKLSVNVPFEEEEASDSEDERESYFLDEKTEVASSQVDTLGFFEGREVELAGVQQNGKIIPQKIRCTGKETDKNLQSFRQDVMNYVNKNLDSLVPEKGQWEIYDIAWPADDYVYVDYAAYVDEDSEDTDFDSNIYSVLLQVSESGGQIKTTQVGYLKMSDSDDDWTVISGENKFTDTSITDNMDTYELDDTTNKWVK